MPKSISLADALVTAMRTEQQGHWFYSMAAAHTEDGKGKEVFSQLAQEELEHAKFLKAQAEALHRSGKLSADIVLGQPQSLAGRSPIFSEQFRSRLGEAHYEMTALGVGIELELSARSFYRRQAKRAQDELARSFFERLAEWESGHYRALLRQQKLLQEEYWNRAGFAPF